MSKVVVAITPASQFRNVTNLLEYRRSRGAGTFFSIQVLYGWMTFLTLNLPIVGGYLMVLPSPKSKAYMYV